MKNKKILNICLLTFALLGLITFIIPFSKFEAELGKKVIIDIMFYLTNAIMMACLAAVIVLSIINLFKDAYNFVIFMEALSLISMLLVFINLLMFSALFSFKINIGYILVAIEVFMLANFSQIARLLNNRKNMANLMPKIKDKKKSETKISEVKNSESQTNKFENEKNKNESNLNKVNPEEPKEKIIEIKE